MKLKYILSVALACTLSLSSCVNDLDVEVIDPSANATADVNALFNKCYANLGVAGNGGANGDCDVDGLDGGTTGFVRQMFNANELTTDESICCWGDDGIAAFNFNQWGASHPMLKGFYYRLYFGVTMCNFYLANYESHDATMTAEVKFLRAYYYFHLLDCFGNVPFATTIALEKPEQILRADLYAWIEAQLKECEANLASPRQNTYGRVDKAAAWMLLARLYLNAEVYTGKADWANAETYAKKVKDESGYTLNKTSKGKWSAYQMLFMGDNGESSAKDEAIFTVLQDGKNTTSWGTTLFLSASTFKPDMIIDEEKGTANGTSETWSGNRCRPDFVAKFFPNGDAPTATRNVMVQAAGDDRALLWGQDRELNIANVGEFTHGYSCAKFLNIYSDGTQPHDAQMMDADFFLMRAAEAYLTYAEARIRQKGDRDSEALAAINEVRKRAGATPFNACSLDVLCDEWSREFYYEGRRRSDLIRFGKFGGNNDYKWQWKGGALNGTSFSADLNIFAIPTDEIVANEKLTQNPGY